jgi:DNA replication and repair protein RecF
MADRREAISRLIPIFERMCGELGLEGDPALAYRPRSDARDPDALVAELEARLVSDIERGFTGHGPHRDDIILTVAGRELRTFGSQGQQRVALLALLLAEREVIGELRSEYPVMLLDDVMSELDAVRRARLVDLISAGDGQTVITATELDHVPGIGNAGVTRVAVAGGTLLQDAIAA